MRHADARCRILVPRLFDAGNTNAQNLNAKALLARFARSDVSWVGTRYGAADPDVAQRPQVRLVKLWRHRFWQWHVAFLYQRSFDAIFYPGVSWFDATGLAWRARLGRRVPVIATLEGLAGDATTEKLLSASAGHPVHCHRVEPRVLKCVRAVIDGADRVIAVSPFLARMGRTLYGDKFSVLPLGVDMATFRPPAQREAGRVPVIVSAGRVAPHKRPQVFLDLAERFPQARFVWYGEGSDRAGLIAKAGARRLSNLEFPGAKSPNQLADALRGADIFVLPSLSEGVPKVTQEAAACGLPVIAYGFYEPSSVIDAQTGFLVWNDEELQERLALLIGDEARRRLLGAQSLALSRQWDWNLVAQQWEERVIALACPSVGQRRDSI